MKTFLKLIDSRPAFPSALCIIIGLLLTSCSSYRLGSTLPPNLKTIAVPVFDNQANYPQLEIESTTATIQEFQRDGTLKVVERQNADLILEVKLVRYGLMPLRYAHASSVSATEYRVLIQAEIKLTQRNGNVMFDQMKVRGESTFQFAGDIATAQRQALPQTARDLAHRIVEQVVEVW